MFGLKSLMKVIQIIEEHAEKEYLDEGKVMKELLQIRLQYETDAITYEEYKSRENDLIQRIKEIRLYKKQQKNEDKDYE